jgi:sugar lactone lactonase YvrE
MADRPQVQVFQISVWGLRLDPQCLNLYFSDYGNNRIRKFDLKTNILTTFAGSSVQGFNSDNILATNANLNQPIAIRFDTNGNIYFNDCNNFRVRKINIATNIITTVEAVAHKVFMVMVDKPQVRH